MKKPSELFEGEDSSLRKTFDTVVSPEVFERNSFPEGSGPNQFPKCSHCGLLKSTIDSANLTCMNGMKHDFGSYPENPDNSNPEEPALIKGKDKQYKFKTMKKIADEENPESWKEDVKYFIGDGLDFLDIEPIIENTILQAKQEALFKGERRRIIEQLREEVRQEEREKVLKDSEELPWEIGGRVLTAGKGKDGWWIVFYEDNSLGFPIDKKLFIEDQTADSLSNALKKMKEYLVENKLLSLREQGTTL